MREDSEIRDEKGHFKKGHHMGRPKGATSERTRQWEALAESITTKHADKFNEVMSDFWESDEPEDRIRAAELYLKVLEYFKPKLARTTLTGDEGAPPVQIIISDKI